MTDKETLLAMFDRAGVVYEQLAPDAAHVDEDVVSVEALKGPANEGYPYFVSVFAFNMDGSLKSIGAWE